MRYVQQKRSRGVGQIGRALASQPVADIILGQHERPNTTPVLRFVLPNPKTLGQREIGEGRIAGELTQTFGADGRSQFVRLLLGPHVAPNQRGPHHLSLLVQENGAVHLSRETDTGDLFRANTTLGQGLPGCKSTGSPPVGGILFGPTDLRGGKGAMLFRRRGNYRSALVDHQRARASGTYVNPKKVHRNSHLPARAGADFCFWAAVPCTLTTRYIIT